MNSYQTLNIAHRGASGTEPENTMRAFEAAYKAGADGIELDVFLSLDKIVVVTHDQFTNRLAKARYNVRKTPFKTLLKLDFGKSERIPTLDQVFKTYLRKFKVINVEIKSTGLKTDGIEGKLVQLIRKHKAEKKVVVSSFNPINIYRVRKLLPEVRIGYLIDPQLKLTPFHLRTIKWLKPDTLNVPPRLLQRREAEILYKLGIPLWLWTLNTETEWQTWLDRGVAAIITNHPEQLYNLMHPQAGFATIKRNGKKAQRRASKA